MAKTTYYKITERELLALIATVDTCKAMVGGGDEDFEYESIKSQKAIAAICKRNNIEIECDYSKQKVTI